ncbi:hypothetical protein ACMV_26820 [Acidiphilium multivorum AIU301]|uniref:Uncharacterized protein n=1 Tax=Acidiphilium multivorum (strain DSM 11245 / JCM 8867 / NBRC 100883 / AIU 301) TaxID=926570 RepID=F0J383_ACIMA|nr:hypothetical protein ACMV_26820 [Acidiphilium multivorum AIU301]
MLRDTADFLNRPEYPFLRVGMLGLLFWGRRIVGSISDHRHRDEGEHHERDVTMPPVPGPGLAVVKANSFFVVSRLSSIARRWPSTDGAGPRAAF